jgi:polysaccharide biosynthesis/export protein
MIRKGLIGFAIAGLLVSVAMPSWAAPIIVPATAPAASPVVPPALKSTEAYLIGPGDVLEIAVWKDEVLTKAPVVRPDGFISFPLIGEVQASGKTTAQLKAEMEKKLAHFVPDVVLLLDIKQINSLIIYVIGKANTPGRFNMNSDVNILQAISMAGGLNSFAKRSSIKIFRHEDGKTRIMPFDYDDVVDGKHLEQNILLKRGDVVVIP